MRIATWNVNSLRARLEKVTWWLARARPDVLMMQETKLADADARPSERRWWTPPACPGGPSGPAPGRAGLTGLCGWGLADASARPPRERGRNTGWNNPAANFQKNLGMRIDPLRAPTQGAGR